MSLLFIYDVFLSHTARTSSSTRGLIEQLAEQAQQPDAERAERKDEGRMLNAKGNHSKTISAFSLQPLAFLHYAA